MRILISVTLLLLWGAQAFAQFPNVEVAGKNGTTSVPIAVNSSGELVVVDNAEILDALVSIESQMSPDGTYNGTPASNGPQVLCVGKDAAPTAVTDGNAQRFWCDREGNLFIRATDGTNFAPTMDAAARRGYVQRTDGTNSEVVDPCKSGTKTTTPFSVAADAELVDGNASVITYICAITFVASAAEVVSIVEGDDGGTCGTNEAALVGSTTDAEGMSFAANAGLAWGNGDSAVIVGKVAAKDVCITLSGTNRTSGAVTWVQR